MVDDISVLLPVHAGVDPEHLQAALASLMAQTRPAEEIVLVEDGPLGAAHHEIIRNYGDSVSPIKVICLKNNSGAGVANEAGLRAARGTWIAKMDADDVCLPVRLEKQLCFVRGHGVDACSSPLVEFSTDVSEVSGVRTIPRSHEEIVRRLKVNNPMNHPSSMYRRTVALEAGGYPDLRYMQDYILFARMVASGARFENMEEPLVAFRADDRMFRRRSSRAMTTCEWQVQRALFGLGIVSQTRGFANFVVRSLFRVLPQPLLKFVYRRLFYASANRPQSLSQLKDH